jgi:hypothetical protein
MGYRRYEWIERYYVGDGCFLVLAANFTVFIVIAKKYIVHLYVYGFSLLLI